jgi:hypothetical protein
MMSHRNVDSVAEDDIALRSVLKEIETLTNTVVGRNVQICFRNLVTFYNNESSVSYLKITVCLFIARGS